MPSRPPFLDADGKVTQAWTDAYGFIVRHPKSGKIVHKYVPTPKQLDGHESIVPNLILEGSRGTGKSVWIRNDAHMRAMAHPGFVYLVIRRTMGELKKSHLKFMPREMLAMGGSFHKTDAIATYPNGSQGFFASCEGEEEMMKLLSSEYHAIYFDEISTFTWTMVTKIGSCLRVPEEEEGENVLAIIRGGTNPIGVGAAEVRQYFIIKDVLPEDDPDYNPDDYLAIHTTLDDNPHIDRVQYIKQLSKLPDHLRRAWLEGEWIIEGAYFHDYKPFLKDGSPWHVTDRFPTYRDKGFREHTWMLIYRALDWGFSPDPAVCLWIAVLPNGRSFVFKEKHWKSTPAKDVARDIRAESEGMRIAETFCDPSMFFGSEASDHTSIGDIFENNKIPLTPSKNDRAAAGYAIHEYLNVLVEEDKKPKVQFYSSGCPMLIRTMAEMRVHKTDPRKIADGNDHWVIALAYYCMGVIGTSKEVIKKEVPRWMRPKPGTQTRLGSESVKHA
jgi:hypothetical protein